MPKLKTLNTRGWKLYAYRWTPTGRRRSRYVSSDGSLWEEVSPSRATHVRKFNNGLSPAYLRRVDG